MSSPTAAAETSVRLSREAGSAVHRRGDRRGVTTWGRVAEEAGRSSRSWSASPHPSQPAAASTTMLTAAPGDLRDTAGEATKPAQPHDAPADALVVPPGAIASGLEGAEHRDSASLDPVVIAKVLQPLIDAEEATRGPSRHRVGVGACDRRADPRRTYRDRAPDRSSVSG